MCMWFVIFQLANGELLVSLEAPENLDTQDSQDSREETDRMDIQERREDWVPMQSTVPAHRQPTDIEEMPDTRKTQNQQTHTNCLLSSSEFFNKTEIVFDL